MIQKPFINPLGWREGKLSPHQTLYKPLNCKLSIYSPWSLPPVLSLFVAELKWTTNSNIYVFFQLSYSPQTTIWPDLNSRIFSKLFVDLSRYKKYIFYVFPYNNKWYTPIKVQAPIFFSPANLVSCKGGKSWCNGVRLHEFKFVQIKFLFKCLIVNLLALIKVSLLVRPRNINIHANNFRKI